MFLALKHLYRKYSFFTPRAVFSATDDDLDENGRFETDLFNILYYMIPVLILRILGYRPVSGLPISVAYVLYTTQRVEINQIIGEFLILRLPYCNLEECLSK
jgi:hypothetical protein